MTIDESNRRTVRSAAIISASAAGGAVAGFFLQLLVASKFGAGAETDAYFMAQSTSEMLSKLLLGGSIAAVFLPIFVDHIAAGNKQKAWHLGLNLLHITALIFLFILILIGFFAEPFVGFIAPGFDTATSQLTTSILRVLLPSFLFLFLVDLTTSMLHALQHFLAPALLRIIAPSASILSLIFLTDRLGIYALAVGVLVGSILQLLVLGYTLAKHDLKYKFILDLKDKAIKKIFVLAYPFIFSVLVTQAAGIVYRILVSDLSAGSLSSLKYAEKITQLLTIMFLSSVTTVIYPKLSHFASNKNYREMRESIAYSIRLILTLSLPIMIGVALLRDPIISVIYQRGSFSEQDASMTSLALFFFVIGLAGNGISSILGHAVLALKATKTAVAVSIASQLVAISLFFFLVPKLQHAGLALASSLVPIAISLLYFTYLTRHLKSLWTIFYHPTLLKLIASSFVLYLVASLVINLTVEHSEVIQLTTTSIAGAFTYLALTKILKISEIDDVLAIFSQKISV